MDITDLDRGCALRDYSVYTLLYEMLQRTIMSLGRDTTPLSLLLYR